MKNIAVIQFPGSNREYDLARALGSVGLHPEIFRWNYSHKELRDYDGYALPGGFAYQDRVRAGVISAKDSLLEVLARESKKGKPILGVCNGNQILVEAGLVPDIYEEVSIGMAPNAGKNNGKTVRTGFISDWFYITSSANRGRSIINYLIDQGEIFPIPIANAEGRFRIRDDVLEEMLSNDQIILRYCDEEGNVDEEYSVNPNGSTFAIAGVCNKQGNVVAMMPHPEAANYLFQAPSDISDEKLDAWGDFERMEGPGPATKILKSMKAWMEALR